MSAYKPIRKSKAKRKLGKTHPHKREYDWLTNR